MQRRSEATVNTSVRFPADLHGRLVREAERQDRTLTSLVIHYARQGLDADERRASEGGR
jgi:hypothetical protein